MLTRIHLYGALAEQYGRVFELDVRSIGEAIHAIDCQFQGFRQAIINLGKKGFKFALKYNGKPVQRVEDLSEGVRQPEIHIFPVFAASNLLRKPGVFQLILAVILIIASYIIDPSGTSTVAVSLKVAAILNAITGVAMLLLSPKMKKKDSNDESYFIKGPINGAAQGAVIPVGYGKLRVAGAPISARLRSKRIPAMSEYDIAGVANTTNLLGDWTRSRPEWGGGWARWTDSTIVPPPNYLD